MENTQKNNNKIYIIGGIVIVLVLGLITYFSLHKSESQITSTPTVLATTLERTLNLTRAGQTSSSEIETNVEASEGDTLSTLSSGRALIENSNGTKTLLDYNSTVTIAKKDPTHASNFLVSGKIVAQVKKVFDKGEFYEIETNNAVATVRGTTLEVSYNQSDTTLLVHEGVVALIPVDPQTRERHFDKETLVKAGMKGIVGANGNIVVSEMSEREKQDPFYMYTLTVQGTVDQNQNGGDQTLRGLISKGQDMKCTYTINTGGISSTATMYISGSNLREDFAMGNADESSTSHLLQTNAYMYAWSGNQGTKISLTVAQGSAGIPTGSMMGSFDYDQNFNYNCTPWQKDDSMFSVPRDVNFIDIGEMMKAQMNR